jgi:hypothetical protein
MLQHLDLCYFSISLLNETVWAASQQLRGKQPRTLPAFASPVLISSEGTVRSNFGLTRIVGKRQLGRWLDG